MKYSIIIPVYNAENYIDRCINSVIGQSFSDFELILVDDGSPDNCPKICDEWATKDSRVRVIHKSNGGVSSARNEGIRQANGEYILFLDGDDWWEQDLLQNCLPYLNDKFFNFGFNFILNGKAEKTANVLSAGEYNFNTQKEKAEFLSNLINNENFFCVCWRSCFKTSFLRDNNLYFSEEYKFSEDLLFICKAFLYLDKFVEADFVGYNYFINPDSFMHKSCTLKLKELNNISFALFEQENKLNLQEFKNLHYKIHKYFIFNSAFLFVDNSIFNTSKNNLQNFVLEENVDFYKEQLKKALKENKPKYRYSLGKDNYYEFIKYSFLKYAYHKNCFRLKLACLFTKIKLGFLKVYFTLYLGLRKILKKLLKKG